MRTSFLERLGDPESAEQDNLELQQSALQTVEEMEIALKKDALDIRERESSLAHNEDLHAFRQQGYKALFVLISVWLAFVAVMLFLKGIGFVNLSDAVLIALLTTSTATVLGIFAIAAKWLFPKN